MVLPGTIRCFHESIRRYSTLYSQVRYVSGLPASFIKPHRAAQQRLNSPYPKARQQRCSVELTNRQKNVSIIGAQGQGDHQQSFAQLADFDFEISKPDDDIVLLKAGALLSLHTQAEVDAVNLVMMELSRLKTGFQAHAAENVPLAAPLPQFSREQALAGALCDFLKAEGFQGCSLADYYRAENLLLHSVLTSRRGVPIVLALLYHEVGHAGGLCLKGVNFPRHSLLRFGSAENTGLLEPFSNRVLSSFEVNKFIGHRSVKDPASLEPNWGCRAPLRKTVFLRRMASHLQTVYRRDDDIELAVRLAPYMYLLDERLSMNESSNQTGGGD